MGECVGAQAKPLGAELARAELPGAVKSARFTSSHSLLIVVAPPQLTGGFWAALTITNPYIATRTTRPVAVAEASERTDSWRREATRSRRVSPLGSERVGRRSRPGSP